MTAYLHGYSERRDGAGWTNPSNTVGFLQVGHDEVPFDDVEWVTLVSPDLLREWAALIEFGWGGMRGLERNGGAVRIGIAEAGGVNHLLAQPFGHDDTAEVLALAGRRDESDREVSP